MSVQPQTNLPIAWNLQPLIPHICHTFQPVAMTLGLGSGSPLFSLSLVLIMLLALYQQIIFGQTIANLLSARAAPLITQVCICGAFSFGFLRSAFGNTHNPKAYWMPDITASGARGQNEEAQMKKENKPVL